MSERKVLNKYYPPDFDPSKIPKLKLPKDRQYVVRLMAPFNMRCKTCGEYIYKGKKFNARKETVQNESYLGLPIFRFYIKCTRCLAEITFKTDPENTDYTMEHGATRNFQAEKLLEEEEKRVQKEREDEELNNPMKVLENRTKDSKLEMEVLENLQELKDLNQRQAHVDFEAMLRQHRLSEEERQRQEQEEDERETAALVEESRKRRLLEDSDSEEDTSPTQPQPALRPNPTAILDESKVDTEYSDPFDAQPHPPPPDDGYMEPYDAQRVMSELPCRRVQLYDTPYEEQDQELGDGPPSGQKPRQSRLPQEDERPADEYDQPWEWKKDHISKAFAVQFDSPDWERTSGSAKELRRPPPRSPQPAERVDPTLPLEKQPWFHGLLSRADAENLLSLCKEGSYLVRLSESSPQDCSLSLRSSQGFLHLKFARTRENQFVLGQHSGPFPSVPELVLHYSSRPLPVQGAEHLALLYPVVSQTP